MFHVTKVDWILLVVGWGLYLLRWAALHTPLATLLR